MDQFTDLVQNIIERLARWLDRRPG